MKTPFKHALVDHPDPAWKVAHEAGISEVRISKLAQGRATPRPLEITNLSKALNRDPEELFPSHSAPLVAA